MVKDFEVRKKYYHQVGQPDEWLPGMRCCLCEKRQAVKVLWPCEHKCLCRKCIERNNIGPKVGHGQRRLPAACWSCSTCLLPGRPPSA